MNTAKITVNNKEYPLLFALTCHRLFIKGISKHKKTFWPEEEGITTEGAVHLIQCAYINACLDRRIDEELSFDDIYEEVERLYASEEGQKVITEYYEIYLRSKEVSKLVEESEEKKSLNGLSQTLTS